jgi:hypothetical protein
MNSKQKGKEMFATITAGPQEPKVGQPGKLSRPSPEQWATITNTVIELSALAEKVKAQTNGVKVAGSAR